MDPLEKSCFSANHHPENWRKRFIQRVITEICLLGEKNHWSYKLRGTYKCCRCITSVVSDSVRSHRRQPTRLRRPWDSPGKNTGVGCHFLLQCRKVKSESEVAQSCLTLCNPMDCSPPGSFIHGIFPGKSTGVGCCCLLSLVQFSR